ncbi:ATP-dependent RNA helicase Mtr4 [Malassezia pachydermatis]|uniref:Antiviral helicase n=1 Tax=Malassezia pachydermatis TaxID=77020 RepID=A0A0M8MMC6_9BASI|nr:antiviral helicase [Malassezia pachydermatis]KOS15386.1 antiviral helicase [Malassezia pachydermatis]
MGSKRRSAHATPPSASSVKKEWSPVPHAEQETKKSRIVEPDAVVTDEFTASAESEVPAATAADEKEATDENKHGVLKLKHDIRHEVAVPPGYDYKPLSEHVPHDPPARTWPFELDPFQRMSKYCIERNESVLVSAHTSAGKTIVAEYAIAQALRDGQRVVYTSPIKALSNQKYREFSAEFGDVGLMTGDVTINPSASCLVMTTEILRSMLYRGSEIMREVAWVVFDEIHYMRDKERGVVWEETIILLPRKVHYVFLSATIPNARQFAEWIAHIHAQPCHVVYTNYRPTPLQHYLFPQGGNGIYLVVDEKGTFREDNFQKAMSALADARGDDPASAEAGKGKKGQTKKGGTSGPSDIYKIVKMIMLRQYNPVIVFAFSKRQCEALALQMSKLEFNTEEEMKLVETIFANAMDALEEDDQALPQIAQILPLLRRGIGIHHGGLLPILKEVIEILFQEGLLKVLFATETFSIGLNMPAKTVVFTAVRKWDGNEFRNLSSGEFIQMSGRAGRRGLDDRGIVIMMFDEKLEPKAAKVMVKGEADRLNSAFHLGYNMILNLMRVEGISPEYMLTNCFYQFQNAASVPALEAAISEAEAERDAMHVTDEEEIGAYYTMKKTLAQLNEDRREVIRNPQFSLPFLQPGRLVQVQGEERDFGWGVVVACQKRAPPRGAPTPTSSVVGPSQYVVDTLLRCAPGTVVPKQREHMPSFSGIEPAKDGGEWIVVPVLLTHVQEFSGIRVFLPKDLRLREARVQIGKNMAEVHRRFPQGLPLLDPVKDMKIQNDLAFQQLLGKIEILQKKMEEAPIAQDQARCKALYEEYAAKQAADDKVKALQARLTDAQNVLQMDELKKRKRVLRRLGFTSADDIVEKKGRVACEISTGDELLLTELMFNGTFNDLTPEQCAALLSCFVFGERSEHPVRLKEELAGPLRVLQDTARHIAKVSSDAMLTVSEQEYVQSFKVELMEAVLQWCGGARFADICRMTDVFEGSIIRAFRRLQELLHQMADAATAIGNDELERKFEEASSKLERPNSIIFSPSLYL